MKTLPLILAAAPVLLAAAAHAQTGCAQVEVSNVRPNQGHLMIAAYASADSYNKQPLVSLRLPAGGATMSFQVCGLSGDAVALSLFQDLDSDGKLARNVLGIPSEPWGSSGNPGAFGPTWETGRVALDGKAITVRMSQ
jgi:uncharacterized protein (DUF2141 family)